MIIMKKIVFLLLLCLTLCFASCSAPAPVERTVSEPETAVAQLTLYAFDGVSERVFGIPNLGHAFVAIKNTSALTLNFFGYNLEPDKEVTVGTWGQSAHWGIWINIEAEYMRIGRYKGIVSLSRGITPATLDKISIHMNGADYWTPTTNCSAFALALWNIDAENNNIGIKGLVTPGKLTAQIKQFESFKTERPVPADTLPCFKNGKEFETVEPMKAA